MSLCLSPVKFIGVTPSPEEDMRVERGLAGKRKGIGEIGGGGQGRLTGYDHIPYLHVWKCHRETIMFNA